MLNWKSIPCLPSLYQDQRIHIFSYQAAFTWILRPYKALWMGAQCYPLLQYVISILQYVSTYLQYVIRYVLKDGVKYGTQHKLWAWNTMISLKAANMCDQDQERTCTHPFMPSSCHLPSLCNPNKNTCFESKNILIMCLHTKPSRSAG